MPTEQEKNCDHLQNSGVKYESPRNDKYICELTGEHCVAYRVERDDGLMGSGQEYMNYELAVSERCPSYMLNRVSGQEIRVEKRKAELEIAKVELGKKQEALERKKAEVIESQKKINVLEQIVR